MIFNLLLKKQHLQQQQQQRWWEKYDADLASQNLTAGDDLNNNNTLVYEMTV